jgi:RNA polymerase sigma factor (sigma-70 family)
VEPKQSNSEESLMVAYRTGDKAAFRHLFDLLGPKLHTFFMRSFKSEAVADDLLQTTFLKVHRARTEYRQDLPLRPWIFAIAARVRLDEFRRRKRLNEDADEEALARADEEQAQASPPAEQSLEMGERATTVRAALDGLPESQRVIIHLHRFEGMSYAEIATVLKTTEGAVKLRAFRAYERLRKQLRPLFPTEGEGGSVR